MKTLATKIVSLNMSRVCLCVGALAILFGTAHASVFYKTDVVAESGLGDFQTFNSSVSINDNGQLAFIASWPSPDSNQDTAAVYAAERQIIGGMHTFLVAKPGNSFNRIDTISSPQINNAGKIVVAYWGIVRGIKVLDAMHPGNVINIGGYDILNSNNDTWGPLPSINNNPNGLEVVINSSDGQETVIAPGGNDDGVCDPGEVCIDQVVFTGRTWPDGHEYMATPSVLPCANHGPAGKLCNGTFSTVDLPLYAHPKIADTGRVVVRAGSAATDPIRLYDYNLTNPVDIAGAFNGFIGVGASPNISADGKIVVFMGDRGQGIGVFASVDDGSPQRKLIRIVGENNVNPHPELGYNVTLDANGVGHAQPLYFSSFRGTYRVGIAHLAHGAPGMIGDSFVVSFMATPNGASRINPATGKPFTFTAAEGIWTVRVDIDTPLKDRCITPGANGVLDTPVTSPDSTSSVVNDSEPRIPSNASNINIITGLPAGISASGGPCTSTPLGDDESHFHAHMPLPVVQIGDVLTRANGTPFTLDGLMVHDSVALAKRDNFGAPRTTRAGDHRVAYYATSGTSQFVITAAHLDSDQDGLLDHWEEEGIDIDQDGVADIDLKAMGANVCKRDVFIEMDWLADTPAGNNGAHTNRPAPGVTQFLVDMFRNAPAPENEDPLKPCAIPAGIEAHIDAGHGLDRTGVPYTRNMPSGPYEGGDQVVQRNTGSHIDIVYLGLPNSLPLPGLISRSLDDIKTYYFGTADKHARELAFHYVFLADFQAGANLNSGRILAVTSSTNGTITDSLFPSNAFPAYSHIMITTDAAGNTTNRTGQIRKLSGGNNTTFNVSPNWAVNPLPGDHYVLLLGSSGLSEINFRQDLSTLPGNDVLISLAPFGTTRFGELGGSFTQSRTIAHELGHNFGLRHGGDDKVTSPNPANPDAKIDYTSLMNYLYQLRVNCVVLPCSVVSYSGADAAYPLPAGVFNDWQNLHLNFQTSAFGLFNASAIGDNGLSADVATARSANEMTPADLVSPLDIDPPTISILRPAPNATLPIGQPLNVQSRIVDSGGIGSVVVSFDINGNGQFDDGITVLSAPDTYSTTFSAVSGLTGVRTIRVKATDLSGNIELITQDVMVVAGLKGDIDGDGDVDQDDINLVLAARGTVLNGTADPRDIDGDGSITLSDARKMVALCTRPRCATK
jgi:hypothetical protein